MKKPKGMKDDQGRFSEPFLELSLKTFVEPSVERLVEPFEEPSFETLWSLHGAFHVRLIMEDLGSQA